MKEEKRIKEYVLKLKKKLSHWEYLYYVKADPEVTDNEYDKTIKEVKFLEKKWPNLFKKDTYTKSIGVPIEGKKKVYHEIPMLSLKQIRSKSEFLDFNKKIKKEICAEKLIYCCELKFDGIAVNLLYIKGKLKQASTRGIGTFGEDITTNIYFIPSIPVLLKESSILPEVLEIRGEIFMSEKDFRKINNKAIKKNKKIFSNPRNATAGLIQSSRKKNGNIPLMFSCYGHGLIKGNFLPKSHWEMMQKFKQWGIPVDKHICICTGSKEVLNFYKKIKQERKTIGFDIDGIVIKLDSLELQKYLGNITYAPKWAIAYKFKAQEALTKVTKIDFQVGRTGIITPIAYFDPIKISGTIIKKATLHNIHEMNKLKIMINDQVIVRRAGEAVPQITKIIHKKNIFMNDKKKFFLPKKCPSCHTLLKYQKDKKIVKCPAELMCKDQLKKTLQHFVSRKAMNIVGMGKKIIDKLVDNNLIKNQTDIFKLNIYILQKIEGINLLKANNLIKSIKRSKKTTFFNFLYSLSIDGIGEAAAFNLAKEYKTLDTLIKSDIKSLLKIKEVGKSTAISLISFFSNKENLSLIKELTNPPININWK